MYRGLKFSNISPNATKSFILDKFLGVDFTRGDYISDYRRSPDAKNIIWGKNPYIFETRTGTKNLFDASLRIKDEEGNGLTVYGIFVYEPTGEILFHVGTKLFRLNDIDAYSYTQIMGIELQEQFSTSFMMNGKLYILGGGVYLEYNGVSVQKVSEIAYIPTTVIASEPKGGGTPFEAVNLLSIWRKNSFKAMTCKERHTDTFNGDSATLEFTLSIVEDITFDEFVVKVNGNEAEIVNDYTVDRVSAKVLFEVAPGTGTDNIEITYYTEDINSPTWQKDYYLDSQNIDYKPLNVVVNNEELTEGEDYSVDREKGIVTFVNGPKEIEGLGGVDNVVITFAKSIGETFEVEDIFETDGVTDEFNLSEENITGDEIKVYRNDTLLSEGYVVDRINHKIIFEETPSSGIEIKVEYKSRIDTRADVINNCSINGIFGGENDTRVFLSGNPDYRNKDWASGLYDPTYFPDTGYTYIGNDNVAIMGYIKQYDTQMIIKEGNQQDGSAYLRTFALDDDNVAYFPVEQGAVGIGAISNRSFAYIQGEPLFLSRQGVVGVSGTNVDNQRLIRDRSELINTVLINEENLQNAFGLEHKNKYYLFVNGKVFICDSRMRYQDNLGGTQYEWMYWDNIKADTAISYKDYLIIGYSGMLSRFKKTSEYEAYIDEDFLGGKVSIDNYWTTPKLYFGSIAVKKSIKDLYMLFTKNNRIRVNIEAIVDEDRTVNLGQFIKSGLLNFNDMNFDDFTFRSFHPTFTLKQRGYIERFDNIKFKISKIEDNIGNPINAAFGVELMQVTYQLLNN